MSVQTAHHAVGPAAGSAFSRDLRELVNQYSRENGSDTPDRILADFMCECLDAFDRATRRRKEWYAEQALIILGNDRAHP